MIKNLDKLLEDIFAPMSGPEQASVDKRFEELIRVDGGIYPLPDWFIKGYINKNKYFKDRGGYAKLGSQGDFLEELRKIHRFVELKRIEVKESLIERLNMAIFKWKRYLNPDDPDSGWDSGSIHVEHMKELIREDIFKPMSEPEQEIVDKQVETVDIIEMAISIQNKFTDKQRNKLWKAFRENGFIRRQFDNFSHVWEKTEPSSGRLSTLNAKTKYLNWIADVINSMTLPWQGKAEVDVNWQHVIANDKSDRVTIEVWRSKRRKIEEDIFQPMGAKELKTIKSQMETVDNVWVYIRHQVDAEDRETLRKCKYKKEDAERPIIRDEIENVLYGLGYIKERIAGDIKYFKEDKGLAGITIKAITDKLRELGIYHRRDRYSQPSGSKEVAWIIKRNNPLIYSALDRAYAGIILDYRKEERIKR